MSSALSRGLARLGNSLVTSRIQVGVGTGQVHSDKLGYFESYNNWDILRVYYVVYISEMINLVQLLLHRSKFILRATTIGIF